MKVGPCHPLRLSFGLPIYVNPRLGCFSEGNSRGYGTACNGSHPRDTSNNGGSPPLFFRVFVCVCFAFHHRCRSGRRTVYPPPHNVNVATTNKPTKTKKNQGGNVSAYPPPPPPSAASRHLHSRPSLFTNPGSATEQAI